MKNDDDVGNGDVYDTHNQDEFRKFVLDSTDRHGVHFMMADGVRFTCLNNLFILFANIC